MSELRILSIIPPMTQLNTPYPSTAYLTGFLRSRGVDAVQADLALALVLKLFSAEGLQRIQRAGPIALPRKRHTPATRFFADTSSATARRSRRPSASCRAATPPWRTASPRRRFLPEGPRFASLEVYVDEEGEAIRWPGPSARLGLQDRARHLATLYLNDLADVLRDAVDPRFEFVRYAESLAPSQPTFDPLPEALAAPPNLVDATLHALTLEALSRHQPTAGADLGAVPRRGVRRVSHRAGDQARRIRPSSRCWAAAIVNTELRELAEPRVFDYFDFVTLDAGERPLLALHRASAGQATARAAGAHVHAAAACATSTSTSPTSPFAESRHADLGRPAAGRLSVAAGHAQPDAPAVVGRPLEQADRRARLLLEEVQLLRREPRLHLALRPGGHARCWSTASRPDRRETGQTGFHFVDEAAPPKALKSLAERAAAAEARRSRGGATSASRSRSRRSCAGSWPTAAASRSPAGWKWRRTGC